MSRLSGFFKTKPALCIFAALVGIIAWSGYLYAFLILLAVPLLFTRATDPRTRLLILFCYYAGSTWEVMPGAAQFFGDSVAGMNSGEILTMWLISTAVLTAPWLWLAIAPNAKPYLAFPFGLCLTALLPTGIANPLTVAGVLFPGLGWAGLAATIVLFGALIKYQWRALAAASVFALICYVSHSEPPSTNGVWEGHQTLLGGSELTRQTATQLYAAVTFVQNSALQSGSKIQVYPEGIITHWTPIADAFWQDTYSSLRENHQTILFGVEQNTRVSGQYLNKILVRGEYTADYQQRVPIPYAMWRPWDDQGVPLNYFGLATLKIGRRRAAPVICYEQLLIAPVLISMTQHPDVIVSIANDYWTHGTRIAEIQESAITAWSRLFQIPLVAATNR
jgi:Carbon-nitrogen hydrolase